MPLASPAALDALELRTRILLGDHPLHDVWQVDLPGTDRVCTISGLLARLRARRGRGLPWTVQALFGVRAAIGAVLDLDAPPGGKRGAHPAHAATGSVPDTLRASSEVPPGTPEGPFVTLYRDPVEAVFAAVNATVDARLLVAIAPLPDGTRLTWATYVRPVGRITGLYMGLIDPFRRTVVYPGLERWLVEVWGEATERDAADRTDSNRTG
jgi:hypothetical protein